MSFKRETEGGAVGYVGVDRDDNHGMTAIGRIVRDAWVFNLLPETETCAGWSSAQIQVLFEQVHQAWEPYAHLPSLLPPELSQRHSAIHSAAIKQARQAGWAPNLDDEDY